jgi:tRNA G46 methylase TrmB
MRKIYDQDWHDFYGEQTKYSAQQILPLAFDLCAPKSAIEIGCGHGHWISTASKLARIMQRFDGYGALGAALV